MELKKVGTYGEVLAKDDSTPVISVLDSGYLLSKGSGISNGSELIGK